MNLNGSQRTRMKVNELEWKSMNSNGSHHFLLMAELAHIFILDAFLFGTPGCGKNLGN